MSDETKRPWDEGADYYSPRADDERLVHESLDDCVEARLEDRDGTIEKAVAGGLTVYAWARRAVYNDLGISPGMAMGVEAAKDKGMRVQIRQLDPAKLAAIMEGKP